MSGHDQCKCDECPAPVKDYARCIKCREAGCGAADECLTRPSRCDHYDGTTLGDFA